MTSGREPRRTLPNLATRTVVMLVAAAVISAAGLVVVDVVTRPEAVTGAPAHRESGEEERPREPHVREGLGELALQLLLVGGIAFAGRKILKIRL
jgi:5-deoxy-D-glucuronate isomerase